MTLRVFPMLVFAAILLSCKSKGCERDQMPYRYSECVERAAGMANHSCIRWKDAGP